MITAKRRSASRRLELRLRGLTSRGTVPKQKIWPKHLFHGCKNEADRQAVYNRNRRQANTAAGLRTDGKPFSPRSRKENRQTAIGRAWHQFRATFVPCVPSDL